MIQVPRDRGDGSGVPIRPAAAWFALASTWTARATAEKTAHEAQRGVYHHDQVHAALEALFHGKCAYCESPAMPSAPWDVEHYRPRGRIRERADHSGYYWLTYTWDNLLLSCQFCNRQTRERPTWDRPAPGKVAGKADHFPLADETTRAMGPDDDLEREARLLLDPTRDDPERHITFDLAGRAVARDGSAQGATSIVVYHLNRRRLVTHRRAQMETVLRLVERLQDRLTLPQALAVLEELQRSDQPWAATVRAIRRDPGAFGLWDAAIEEAG